MQKVILDLKIVESLFKKNTTYYNQVKTFLNKYKNKVQFLLDSSQIFLLSLMYPQKKKFIKQLLKDFNIHILSTTGSNIWKALEAEDTSEEILISLCNRVGNNCIIVTIDESFAKKYPQVELLRNFQLQQEKIIPIVDLQTNYFEHVEGLEEALLKAASRARYILGEDVRILEEEIAAYIGTKYAVGVASGTDALVLSLRALAIKTTGKEYFDKEDLIITTPFTFTATGEAILRAGATPLFVDIELETYNIDPLQIKKAIQKYGKRVKGIIPVHLYGHPADMSQIMQLAEEYNLFVVEDCAQSLGAQWKGKQTGSFGDLGAFSFFPTKPLGGFGDGGMITTNDAELYELVLMLRKHGGKDKYNVQYIGYNSRLDTIQAAVLLEKFKNLEDSIKKRRAIAEFYNKQLGGIKWIKTPKEREEAYHVYHQYTIFIKEGKRNELKEKLKEKGIQTMVYYPVPLHHMEVFKKGCMEILGSLENSEKASRSVLSLPLTYKAFNKLKDVLFKI